ncbi:MAG: uridine kinase [Frankiaceae bacterium]
MTPAGLVELLADLIVGLADGLTDGPGARRPLGHPARVAIDGAPAADPAGLAAALVDPLRVRGHPVVRVPAAGFVRPASVRLERGRTDPDALYELALDTGALLREVLVPLGPGGSGRFLASLWDAGRDRATRAPYLSAGPATVVLIDGALLLRPQLRAHLDLAVHLHLSPAALARRTPAGQRWALEAHARYEQEAAPLDADVIVRMDDPRRPAVVVRP